MDSSEKNFNKRQSFALVAFMSLDIMFPDEQVRALAKAAGKGRARKVKELVSLGVDVNSRGNKNATALFWAMKSKSIEGFTVLLELGANPNVVFDDGGSVMHWVVKNNALPYLKVALKYGGDPNLNAGSMFQQQPIFDAISIFRKKDDMVLLQTLIDAGADINVSRSNGDYPITMAASLGRFDIVYKLLIAGADYLVKDSKGNDVMTHVKIKRHQLDPNHELFRWMEKVSDWLGEK